MILVIIKMTWAIAVDGPCISLSVMCRHSVSMCKTAEWIEALFGVKTLGALKNIDGILSFTLM